MRQKLKSNQGLIRKLFIIIMLLPLSMMAANTTGIYNVRDYGAKGDGIRLQNVEFELMHPDERPEIELEDVANFINESK